MDARIGVRIPCRINDYMDQLITDGIFVTKSDIVRSALIFFLDRPHELLPEIPADGEAEE